MLWIVFALMTAAAILAVLWPLSRRPRTAPAGSDLVVYRDQLQEIDRDRNAGLIGEPEAEAARIEVSRRLLAAADNEPPSAPAVQPIWHRRAAAIAALLVLSSVPVGLYIFLGSPSLPGQPAFARAANTPEQQSIATLIGRVEAHLAQYPNDGAGWEVIAPVYMRLRRFDDAVTARRRALALNGETAARDAALGEALVAAANGVVTDEAKRVLTRAAALDAHAPEPRYFLGLADEQDGNREAAAAKWRALLADAPPGAPWADFVRAALARVSGEPVAALGPSATDVSAASQMSDAQRGEMIRSMVTRLADRLRANGADVDGWLRLVRAYVVLGDTGKARDAAAAARRALAAQPDAIRRIDDLVRSLGLQG